MFNRTIFSDSQFISQGLEKDFLNEMVSVVEFNTRFESSYDPVPEEIITYLPFTYDATRLMLMAIEACGVIDDQGNLVIDRKDLIAEIRRISFEGITGNIAIDGNGNRDTYPGGN